MALQTAIFIEVEKNDHKYVFHMPIGVPLQECYEASVEVTKEIVEFSKKMEEQQKKEEEAKGKEEAAAEEEVKEDGAIE